MVGAEHRGPSRSHELEVAARLMPVADLRDDGAEPSRQLESCWIGVAARERVAERAFEFAPGLAQIGAIDRHGDMLALADDVIYLRVSIGSRLAVPNAMTANNATAMTWTAVHQRQMLSMMNSSA